MCNFDIVCVTDRELCKTDFLNQIEKICKAGISRIILREKQLNEDEYSLLLNDVNRICKTYNIPLSAHSFWETAKNSGIKDIHLPYENFMSDGFKVKEFNMIGTSVHSVREATDAEKKGASYVTAGHIFKTDCKKGLPPRGVEFLKDVCSYVKIPVYAIGGVSAENISLINAAGASGACVMSGLMKSQNPAETITKLRSSNLF